jgi:hypothetical protein
MGYCHHGVACALASVLSVLNWNRPNWGSHNRETCQQPIVA